MTHLAVHDQWAHIGPCRGCQAQRAVYKVTLFGLAMELCASCIRGVRLALDVAAEVRRERA